MFMIWDSRLEDLQLFWLNFQHCMSLQLIWRSGTHRVHLGVLDLHMSCRDITTWQGTRTAAPARATRWQASDSRVLHEGSSARQIQPNLSFGQFELTTWLSNLKYRYQYTRKFLTVSAKEMALRTTCQKTKCRPLDSEFLASHSQWRLPSWARQPSSGTGSAWICTPSDAAHSTAETPQSGYDGGSPLRYRSS